MVDPKSQCGGSITCVYQNFFGFLNLAAIYARNAMGENRAHLIIASLSDVDAAWLRMNQFEHLAPQVDAWGLQIYRGKDFGRGDDDFLANYESKTKYNARGERINAVKPIIVVEYGVDAYNDPCGKGMETVSSKLHTWHTPACLSQTAYLHPTAISRNSPCLYLSSAFTQPCYNDVQDSPHGGYGEDEDSQADWGASLASILSKHSSAEGKGAVAGGTINSWVDEAWKASTGVAGCGGPVPYPLPGFDPSQCAWKAHVQCPMLNLWRPSLCGFWTPATFDGYSNQGWYGLMRPSPQAGDVDRLTPRLLYGRLQQQWNPHARAWGWLLLLGLSFAAALLLTQRTFADWKRRSAQVRDLELRSAASASSSASSSAFGHGRSPNPPSAANSPAAGGMPGSWPSPGLGRDRKRGPSSRAAGHGASSQQQQQPSSLMLASSPLLGAGQTPPYAPSPNDAAHETLEEPR